MTWFCINCGWRGPEPAVKTMPMGSWNLCPKCEGVVQNTRFKDMDYKPMPYETGPYGRLRSRVDEGEDDYRKRARRDTPSQITPTDMLDLYLILQGVLKYYGSRCECSCKDK